MKLVILDNFAMYPNDLDLDRLKGFADEVESYPYLTREEQLKVVKDADYLVINKVLIDNELLDIATKVKYIGIMATGTDNIDLAECRKRNIDVANVPNYSGDSVAQLTFALLLHLCQSSANFYSSVQDHYWRTGIPQEYNIGKLTELSGKTIGLVGYGDIAKIVADIAAAFKMKVIVSAQKPRQDTDKVTFVTFDQLVDQSDVISLHCPATPNTIGIINDKSISKMKDGVIIINTARGKLIDEQAMEKALHSGKVGRFGADVLETEPMVENCPFRTTPNTVVTPHIAWATTEALARLTDTLTKNMEMYLKGTPQNIVN